MADNSLGNLSYKDSPVSGSTNHKADLIQKIFHEYKIALQTINEHGLIDEFRNAVMSPCRDPQPKVVKKQYGIQKAAL